MRFILIALLVVGPGHAFQTLSHVAVRRLSPVEGAPISKNAATIPMLVTRPTTTALEAFRFPFINQGSAVLSDGGERIDIRTTLGNRIRRWVRRVFFAACLFFLVNFSALSPAFAGGSGGRMGGSFKSSMRAPVTRSLPRPSMHSGPIRSYHRSAPRMIIHRSPHVHMHAPSHLIGDTAVMTGAYPAPVRRVSLSDVVLVTGVGTVVSLNVMDRLRKDGGSGGGLESSLGAGVSVLSLTVAVNVPDRDSPNSILARLSSLALTARTNTRRGVQNLITETALELLRQKDAIVSVDSQYSHFRRTTAAEREFNALSIGGRSKFAEETLTNYGGQQQKDRALYAAVDGYPRATVAIVTINLCIEGDSTRVSKIRNRIELQSALSRIASDCQVDDCLLSAEVLWSPESRTEKITSEEIYADYPSLFPLYD